MCICLYKMILEIYNVFKFNEFDLSQSIILFYTLKYSLPQNTYIVVYDFVEI